jgi:MoaA/NifB/PqqE/SkfB family radical SAM enzyme
MAARYRLRMGRGRRAVLRHLQDPAHVPVPMPTFVQFRVTNLCNLRCKMCGQWGDTGIYREQGAALAGDGDAERARIRELIGLRRQLALADYVRILDELAPHRPIVSLFGGEPLLYPEIVPLAREIKRRGLTLTMITNGSQLERHAEGLVDAGIDVIAVSVDGPPDVHDRIRGQKGSFARLAAGVRAVAERRRRGKGLPALFAIFPITELNLEIVREGVDALRQLPLDAVNVGLRWFVPPDDGAAYEAVMAEAFGVSGSSWKGFEFTWPSDPERRRRLEALVPVLSALKRSRVLDKNLGRPWTSFVPDIAPKDVPAYFTEPDRTFGHDLCPVAWYFAQVEPDGEVCFCGDFPDYSIGNVRTERFTDVWTSDRAGRFREKLAREPLPICARCCGSYVYGRWERPAAGRTATYSLKSAPNTLRRASNPT